MLLYTIIRRVENTREAKDSARRQALVRLLPVLGVSPDQTVSRDAEGRLFLPHCPAVDFNLSHADGFTVLVAGRTRVGVDLECVERIRDPEGLARRFFTEREQQAVLGAPDLATAVCEMWTRKEAVGKYIGTGLSRTLSLCTFAPPEDTSFYTETFFADGRTYLLTVCAHEVPRQVNPFDAE